MGKVQTGFLAAGATLLLAASAAASIIVPPMISDSAPNAASAEVVETPSPALTLPAEGYVVLTPETAQVFPDARKSQPNGTFDVLNGVPQGYPYGVPVQVNAHLRGALWHFEDSKYQFLFSGDQAAFDTLVEQFSFAEWKLIADEELAPGLRSVKFSNEVWEAQLLVQPPQEGRDPSYTVNLTRLSPSE
jgi:hypothetical protein